LICGRARVVAEIACGIARHDSARRFNAAMKTHDAVGVGVVVAGVVAALGSASGPSKHSVNASMTVHEPYEETWAAALGLRARPRSRGDRGARRRAWCFDAGSGQPEERCSATSESCSVQRDAAATGSAAVPVCVEIR
jgi:hypothetical protein